MDYAVSRVSNLICKVSECEKTHKGTSRGMCWMHYYRERRHGSVDTTLNNPETASMQERFYALGWTVKGSGCWEWAGARNDKGYGQLGVYGTKHYAHRVSYELATSDYLLSDSTRGDVVMHSCDNPPCVNPSHLSRGTHQDNMDDMVTKGRHKTAPKLVGR